MRLAMFRICSFSNREWEIERSKHDGGWGGGGDGWIDGWMVGLGLGERKSKVEGKVGIVSMHGILSFPPFPIRLEASSSWFPELLAAPVAA